ncbi:MAG: fumarylacetoacetate hydrolase family protein [Bryobacteraceae bacterium]|nr:fumarylacetoacetate hydrolase family protein [Bryobacteraceae bacterium]MDW8378598.1 fumarylacetoacetate hydrolase family protein [Bryobacterales bacterium]
MRLVTFRNSQGTPEPGVATGEQIIGLKEAGFASMLEILAQGADCLQVIQRWIASPPASSIYQAASVKLMAPVPRPPKIFCVGLNYRDHAEESNMPIPDRPTIFSKFANTVIGPGDPIVLPKISSKPDYEAEFAFVIGPGGKHIPQQDWQKHVFGYMNLNDVSARDIQLATSQWLMGKTFDTFAPMGPYLVTADEIPDPHQLSIKLIIRNQEVGTEEVLQDSNTRNLIFKLPYLVEYLSSVCTLEPGDVITTGTPGGVGFARKPPRFLRPGDEVTVAVEGLGELTNPVVAEA